ncbi:MAG: GumC family protein [Bacteroidota bacterium]
MSTKVINKEIFEEQEKTIDLNRLIMIVLSRWYVPVITTFISISIAFIQLRYTSPLFSAQLTLKFDDDKGSQITDLFKYGRVSGRIENLLKTESEVMKSRSMNFKVLKYLKMNFDVFVKGEVISSRLYPNYYFKCELIQLDSADVGKSITFKFNNEGIITLLDGENKNTGISINLGDTVHIGNSTILITPNLKYIDQIDNQPILVIINNLQNKANQYASKLSVDVEKNTNILSLSFTADVPQLARDYLNALAKVYIQETISNKAQAAEQTIRYIDTQLVELSQKVKYAQNDLAGFKSQIRGGAPNEVSKINITQLISLEAQKGIMIMRSKQLENLEKNIRLAKNKTVELIVFDVEDAKDLSELFNLMNELILERISISSKQKSNSPIMLENERKISEVKAGLLRAIISIRQNMDDKLIQINRQIKLLENELKGLPDKEQALFNLERTFKINEKIYGYLQEKRLENLISMSSLTSNAAVIDEAVLNPNPIFPKPSKNYGVAIFLGLVASIVIILLDRILYNKITDKETIELMSRTPIIGVIKKIHKLTDDPEYNVYVLNKPKSIFAESIRGIRTNMNFVLKGEKNKFICITSSVSGEGKTFCTINLAASLTLLGHKVLVVGCDLRRPRIHLSFKNLSNEIGLTTYLIQKNSLEEVIKATEHENLYVLPAGPVPPNPAELLQSNQFQVFMDKIRTEFDYVFFDTAPVGLVSDSFPLMASADINLYILRAQYSKRDFAIIPDRLTGEISIKNMFSVLNSFDANSIAYSSIYKTDYGGYYGGGGYYYYGGYYYGKGSYGYSGSSYYSSYYSGYYSDDEINPKSKIGKLIQNLLKKVKLKK